MKGLYRDSPQVGDYSIPIPDKLCGGKIKKVRDTVVISFLTAIIKQTEYMKLCRFDCTSKGFITLSSYTNQSILYHSFQLGHVSLSRGLLSTLRRR
ncbi:hypothetical protein VNO77_33268 [Canavalia gladiata]|uniref:Uncharacterized protein n=1 Tax=Canavalia gladiata TaxID=3824 RepID=A0AAN9KBG4_CANGL